jgi:Ser/Thr protein kinase RdoA (MazF antagonist)
VARGRTGAAADVTVAAATAVEAARRALAAWFSGAARIDSLGAGHINDTWLVTAGTNRWVLQRLSERVFPDPVAVMGKVAAVVAHLRAAAGVRVPALLDSRAGDPFHFDDRGVWRLWEFVAPTRTLQALAVPAQARAAGAAFGRLQRALADFPGEVADPIPGFMRLDHYLQALDRAVAEQPLASAAEALREIDRHRPLAGAFSRRDRLIHGDCKVNNLLFEPHRSRVVAVIDLDTVMRGHWAWDFGDLARSAAAGPRGFSVPRYRAVVSGFLRGAEVTADVEALVLAPRYVTVMLAARFLTDHLQGDRYFKVAARGDNLRRAGEQLRLLRTMVASDAAMRAAAARA